MVVGRLRIQGELVQVSHWVVFFKLQLRIFLVSFYLESGEYNIVPAPPPAPIGWLLGLKKESCGKVTRAVRCPA